MEQRHARYHNDQWRNNQEVLADRSFDLTDHLDSATHPSHPNSLDLPKLDIIDGESADVPESLGIVKFLNYEIFFQLIKIIHFLIKNLILIMKLLQYLFGISSYD